MTTSTPPARFEDRLLAELRDVVAERPAHAPVRAHAPRHGRRTRLAVAGAVVAAALAATVVLATGGGTSSAYAVQSGADGTVTVTIHDLRDADGLERNLRAAGVAATVDYSASPATCAPGTPASSGEGGTSSFRGDPGDGPSLTTGGTAPAVGRGGGDGLTTASVTADGGASFTLDPRTIRPGAKLLITASDGAPSSVAMSLCPPGAAAP